MSRQPALWPDPIAYLRSEAPDAPVLFFAPSVLAATHWRFRDGFPGRVTYAVKANDSAEVLTNLVASGMTAFDVASPREMRLVRAVSPTAVLHYNNPVRSVPEIEEAVARPREAHLYPHTRARARGARQSGAASRSPGWAPKRGFLPARRAARSARVAPRRAAPSARAASRPAAR